MNPKIASTMRPAAAADMLKKQPQVKAITPTTARMASKRTCRAVSYRRTNNSSIHPETDDDELSDHQERTWQGGTEPFLAVHDIHDRAGEDR